MENITLGQIGDAILYLAAIAGGIGVLYKLLMTGIQKQLEPIKQEQHNEKMKRLKSDITNLICLVEQGIITNEQKLLLHEDYDEYAKNGGNSWVHDKMESLHKEGKI